MHNRYMLVCAISATLRACTPGNVWAVAFLPNGDLVTATSDHIARVWTTDEARQAPAEAVEVRRHVGKYCARLFHMVHVFGCWVVQRC